MKTLTRRVYRLEESFALRLDEDGYDPVAEIRERRRRRLAAEGREPEEDSLPENLLDGGHRSRTIAEVLRSYRFRDRRR